MDYSEACSDVWYLLESLKPTELAKIPKKLIETIHILKKDDYISKIDLNTPLEEQELSDATIGLISFIYSNYLGTEEEKNKYETGYKQYIEANKQGDYAVDFKKKNEQKEPEENKTEIVVYSDKPNIFLRILNKVKKLFNKRGS